MDDYTPPSALEVTITDLISVPFLPIMGMFQQADFYQETEEGYQKSMKAQGYPAIEKVQTGDYKSCELTVFVENRFLVEYKLSNSDRINFVKHQAEETDLNGLAKLVKIEIK